MARVNKSARRRQRKAGVASAGLWLSLGLAIGVTAALILYDFVDSKFADKKPRQTAGQTKKQAGSSTQTTSQESPASRFDFYTLLPELEVVIPEDNTTLPEQEKDKSSTPALEIPDTQASGGYLLQAGSFQRHSEADSMKARLALLGVEANIQTVNVNKDTWHRVRIGPYEDRDKLNEIREHLRKNHIDSLLMKARQ